MSKFFLKRQCIIYKKYFKYGECIKKYKRFFIEKCTQRYYKFKTKSELGEIKAYFDSVVVLKVQVYFLVILFKYFM